MKPDWDKLMEEFGSSPTKLVADVDCTGTGEALCKDVQGFPTLKWGDPSNLEDYEGERDYDSLKTFAEEQLKPMCSPSNIDLCDDDKKAEIAKYQAMSADDLAKSIQEKEDSFQELEDNFMKFVEGLQAQYEEETKKKEAGQKEIKESGLGLMKAVAAAAGKTGTDEL